MNNINAATILWHVSCMM